MNNFQILELIGQGSYSKVYKVKRIEDQVIYGLKRINFPKLSQQDQQNALNEVRIIASIRSPYIISYKEAFFDDKQNLCIVMEYMDKGDLHHHVIKRNKNKEYFSEQEIWNIFGQLSRGLKVIHDLNIIHRDIKSANVFLGSNGEVKLGDFNVSKITDSLWLNTQTGTPYYSSPEIWLQRPYNFKTDIWSLGCVMYDMSALEPPFFAIEPKQVLNNILRDKYTELPDFYSQDLKNLLKKCLTNSILNRPNADDIYNIIQNKFKFPYSNMLKEKKGEYEPELLQTIRISQNIFGPDYEGHRTLYFKKMLPQSNYKSLNLPPEIQQSFLEHLYMYSTQESEKKSLGLSSSQQQQKSGSSTLIESQDSSSNLSPLRKSLAQKKKSLLKINSSNTIEMSQQQQKIKMRVNALHSEDKRNSSSQLQFNDNSISINESLNHQKAFQHPAQKKASQRNASVSPLQHRRNLKQQQQLQQAPGFIQSQNPQQLQQLQQQQHEENIRYKENHSMSPVRKNNNNNQIQKGILVKKRQSLVMPNSNQNNNQNNSGKKNNNNSFQQIQNNNHYMNMSPVQQNKLSQQQILQQQQQQQQQQQLQQQQNSAKYNHNMSPEHYLQQQKRKIQQQSSQNLSQIQNMNSSINNDSVINMTSSKPLGSQQNINQVSSQRNISPFIKNNIMNSSQKMFKQKQNQDLTMNQDNINIYQKQMINPLTYQKNKNINDIQQKSQNNNVNDMIKQNLKDTLFKNQKKQVSYLNQQPSKPQNQQQQQQQQINQQMNYQQQQQYMEISSNLNNNNNSQHVQKLFDPFAQPQQGQQGHYKKNSHNITDEQRKLIQQKIYKFNNSLSPNKKKSYQQQSQQNIMQQQQNIYSNQVLKTEGDEASNIPIIIPKNQTSISSQELNYSYQKHQNNQGNYQNQNGSNKVLPNIPQQKRKSNDFKSMNNINQPIKITPNKNGQPSSSKDLSQQFYQNQKGKSDTKLTQQLKQLLQKSQA